MYKFFIAAALVIALVAVRDLGLAGAALAIALAAPAPSQPLS